MDYANRDKHRTAAAPSAATLIPGQQRLQQMFQQQLHSYLRYTIMTAFFVVGLGAYTRLSDAGLGCPDWPKCYGNWIVQLNSTQPSLSFTALEKAWIEMLHRYLAGMFSCTVMGLNIWHYRHMRHQHWLLNLALLTISFQALFGMWTVTWKLHPLAVMPHLLGGMSITCLLYISYLQVQQQARTTVPRCLSITIHVLLFATILQIGLGGWTSANYAQLICPDFPTCQGQWWPDMSFSDGFRLPAIGPNYAGGIFNGPGRIAIHMTHRLTAYLISAVMLVLLRLAYKYQQQLSANIQQQVMICAGLLGIQITLGILNIHWQVAWYIALAHNLTALALLLSLIKLSMSSTSIKHAIDHAG